MREVIPAILTDDNEVLKTQLKQAEEFGAQTVQIDFTDGEFVSSKTLLPDELDAFILGDTSLTLEAHLMVENPEQYFATLYTLGFRRIAVHFEALGDPHRVIREMREYGMELGFAINPETALEDIEPHIKDLDFVLFLTVVPGEQGHPFETEVLDKIKLEHIHGLREKHKDVLIEVDGGVKKDNITDVAQAGAERIVVGSGIWKTDNSKMAYEELCDLANNV